MKCTFIKSAADIGGCPSLGLAEFAFVGRSNVGKSSLLNRLAGANIARTSKTPGRTQLVNFFSVESRDFAFILADLPGYGFARAPRPVRRAWYSLLEDYLTQRRELVAVLQLVDLRRDVQTEDLHVHEWLKTGLLKDGIMKKRDATAVNPGEPEAERLSGEGLVSVPSRHVLVVGTKADKLSKAHRKPKLKEFGLAFGKPREQMLLSSSTQGLGIEAIRDRIKALALASAYDTGGSSGQPKR